MPRVVPLIAIGDGNSTLCQGEFHTALIAGGFDPPILVGETPPGPFGHTIVGRILNSRDFAGIVDPAGRRDVGPDGISSHPLVDVRPQRQAFEILRQQHKGLLGLRHADKGQDKGQQQVLRSFHFSIP